ncbi:uncharacterized protein BDZ99DRAFT_516024 [Mytilinidion resinicola]|uniref:Uncharacterized protein n=1 Tax=Mytilinidion resinicola TaxID=574789 RepID=A0A6A6Z390_9PEZI|nr:uncharacterized protein BDZ99DRAFT_516024 [Mytilinidion resinicola]KAF2815288.1 hypothetical protein BDZ99DRAFT_516024 [Mytilinidion resinicola]
MPWLDVQNTTRAAYTRGLTSLPLPTNAKAEWLSSVTKLRTLLTKLAEHPAMAPNLQQTYSTPSADKNNVYFMWDFVGRTLVRWAPFELTFLWSRKVNSRRQGMYYNIDPQLAHHRPGEPLPEDYADVIGRCVMAQQLILDTKPGMLDMMTEMTYPEQKGRHPRFGEEILGLARGLMES